MKASKNPLRCRSEDIITYGRTKISILVTVLFSVLYNVPRFFEISWTEVTEQDELTGENVTHAETIATGTELSHSIPPLDNFRFPTPRDDDASSC